MLKSTVAWFVPLLSASSLQPAPTRILFLPLCSVAGSVTYVHGAAVGRLGG